MPQVTLINSAGMQQQQSGGCFGFTGRSGNVSNYDRIVRGLPSQKIVTFRYHIGQQWGDDNQEGLLNPVPFLKWICGESSWAKYVTTHNMETTLSDNSFIDIKCDIPGHCVIGTASALRLAAHRRHSLIPFFNMAVANGSNPAIAFLVFYAMYLESEDDLRIIDGLNVGKLQRNQAVKVPNSDCEGKLNLGDDEVMKLHSVHPGLLYSFVSGEFEMERADFPVGREHLYETGSGYEQKILSSFRKASTSTRGVLKSEHSFPRFLLSRFHPTLPKRTYQKIRTASMNLDVSANFKHPVFTTSLLGWAATLSQEFKVHNKFLGWAGL